MRTIIPDIDPFARFFYKDCYYNSLFAIINKYKQNPFCIIANETPLFSLCTDKLLGGEIQYVARLPEAKVLEKYNIAKCPTYEATHLDCDIVGSITQGNPVILFVDCFFEPIRQDMYGKEHFDHSLLLYGFDDERKVFLVFEHNNRFSLNYVSTELSFADAQVASKGYANYFGAPDKPLWIKFMARSCLPAVDEGLTAIEYISNAQWQTSQHPSEEKAILTIFDSLINYLSKPFIPHELGQLIAEEITKIINARNVELLCIQSLDHFLVTLLEKIVDDWTIMRLAILTLVYGENTSDAKKRNFFRVLNELRSMEMTRRSFFADRLG